MVTARKVTPPLEAAVKRELAEAAKRSPGAEKSAVGVLALHLAREVEGGDPLSARVAAAKILLESVDRLRAIAPAAEAKDRLDDLAKRRDARKAAVA